MATNNSCDYTPSQFYVQTGGLNGTLNSVMPSATLGVPLISQGVGNQPIFGTVALFGGGTNAQTFSTINGIIKYDGTSLVSSTSAKIDSSNRTTNSSQPCFLARLGSNITNATGDGTVYTPLIFDTSVYDQNSNYGTGTGLFTAPVTGRYFFSVHVTLTNLAVTHTRGQLIFKVNSSANTYLINVCNVGVIRDATNNSAVLQGSGVFNLSSGNTFFVQVEVDNSTKTVTILGDNESTFISGYLVA